VTATLPAVVIGATGYVGGELLRLISGHPTLTLHAAVSSSRAGTRVADLFPALVGCYPETEFVALFSAAPHGASALAVAAVLEGATSKSMDVHAVDVSADFRYASADEFAAIYGQPHPTPALLAEFRSALPEHLDGTPAQHIGHPGCFATAMLLAAVPLYAAGLADGPLFVTGITGSTGSGRTPSAGTHHPERHSNLYAYKPLTHRHVPEVRALIAAASGQRPDIRFIPHSGPFARGIYVTAQATLAGSVDEACARAAIANHYAGSRFVRTVPGTPRLKDVVASNFAHLGVAVDGDAIAVTCAIDNLVKGAAGGAVQWMNRLWSLPEDSGLMAPSPAWT
jgi:N-acetyl-gamma-glutamyl-phosphate reductase common form